MNGEPSGENSAAIVLTGGRSSRMGRPKALLPFGGEPLVAHTVRTLARLFAEIVVVAEREQPLPEMAATVVRDEISYQGPVGGITYGLREAKSESCFVASCDLPFINLPLVSYLLSQIPDHDVVVPHWEGRLQPLHAVYRRSVLPLLEMQLEKGELRPIFLYEKVRTLEVAEEVICRFDPEGLSFVNMNTPEDYEAARTRWEKNRQRQRDETEPALPRGLSVSVPIAVSVPVTVELFGTARLRAKTSEIFLALQPGATLAHVFLALAEKLPVLVGAVIAPEKDSLTRGHTCNINGRDFVRNPNARVHPGDRIFILSADAGG